MSDDFLSLTDFEAGPTAGTRLAGTDDLSTTGSKNIVFQHGDSRLQVLIHHAPTGIVGYINSCPHARVPLNLIGDQFLDHSGRFLQCSTHGARFDPGTGLCISGPCKGERLLPIKLKIKGNDIFAL